MKTPEPDLFMSAPRRAAACLSLICILTAAVASAQMTPLTGLQALDRKGALVSALVVDLAQNKVLAQIAPDLRLSPASVSKLFITAAALEQWGPDSVFTTVFSSAGALRNGTLEGDLIFVGAGDPDLDAERLWLLITRLRQAGVRQVQGDLVVNDHLYGAVTCQITDRCQARERSDNAYDAPLSAAGVNFSNIELSILPADTPGQPARLQLLPPGLADVTIDGAIKTAARNASAVYSVRRVTERGVHKLQVSGQVPAGRGPFRVQRSVALPSRFTGNVLARMLADSGIAVSGHIRVESTPLPADARTLAEVESPALAQQLRRMMTYSNNYMADTLTLNLLAYSDVPGPYSLALASRILESYARDINADGQAAAQQENAQGGPLVLKSGSGLSIKNRLSARDVTALLDHMYHQNALFPAFLGSLPVPLYAPSRSLKRGNIEWLTRVAVKTGSLSEPVTVRGLAGYFRMQDGGWGAFAAIVNGNRGKYNVPYADANQAIISDMEAILAQY